MLNEIKIPNCQLCSLHQTSKKATKIIIKFLKILALSKKIFLSKKDKVDLEINYMKRRHPWD